MTSKHMNIATPTLNICSMRVDRSEEGFGLRYSWFRLPTEEESQYCEAYFQRVCTEEKLLTQDELDALVTEVAHRKTWLQ